MTLLAYDAYDGRVGAFRGDNVRAGLLALQHSEYTMPAGPGPGFRIIRDLGTLRASLGLPTLTNGPGRERPVLSEPSL